MDYDSVLNFKNAMSKENPSTIDLYMVTSIINNHNLELNISLRENMMRVLAVSNDPELLDSYLDNFVRSESDIVDVPCYYLLLSNITYWNLLLEAHKLGELSEESLLVVVEFLVNMFIDYDQDRNYDSLSKFILDLISVRKPKRVELFNESASLNKFVYEYVYCLYLKTNPDGPKTYSLLTRYVLLKLFSFGYIKLNYLGLEDPTENFLEIVEPLIEQRSFNHLLLLINKKTVSMEEAYILRDVIYSEIKKSDLDDEKFIKFIDGFNAVISTINPEVRIDVDNVKKR